MYVYDNNIFTGSIDFNWFCEINNGPQIAGAISKNAVVVVFANIRDSGIC